MTTTIEKLSYQNFRGTKAQIDFGLPNGQSLLLYGDNGSGKSSVLDAVEWFITDSVSHLSGEEVETHGGIKNTLAELTAECSVSLEFKNPTLASKRKLTDVKGKFKSEFEPEISETLKSQLVELQKEKLWIRNVDLVTFVLGTKTERLNDLSGIIGFDVVSNTKSVLKKAANDIRTVIKNKNFQTTIATEKDTIAKNLGSLVATDDQFIEACNKAIEPIDGTVKIASLAEVETAIKTLSTGSNSESAQKATKLAEISTSATSIISAITPISTTIATFLEKRTKFLQDADRLKKLSAKQLLDSAAKILEDHPKDDCPLCLQVINREDLLASIQKRLFQLKQIKEEADTLDSEGKKIIADSQSLTFKIESWVKQLSIVEGEEHTAAVTEIGKRITEIKTFTKNLSLPLFSQTLGLNADCLSSQSNQIDTVSKIAAKKHAELIRSGTDPKIGLVSKLSIVNNSYSRLVKLNKELVLLNSQADSLDKLVTDFTEQQKQGMKQFLNGISKDMNEYYVFMNPGEKVDGIELACIDDKHGEFAGVSVNFKFHGVPVDSPRKYLSESHINAIGLCLFLATVRAFNKKSKFLILDDVISSFDKNHRTMFARLLVQKFSDLQLLVLTHETDWFDYFSSLVKGNGWKIYRTTWDLAEGSSINLSSGDIRAQIDSKIGKNDETDLGNLIRRYGERKLKEIAVSLGTPVAFRFNERNEGRTFDELYSAIRSQVGKKSPETSSSDHIKQLATCQFFTNKTSHDNPGRFGIADLKVALSDLENFVGLFSCKKCSKLVSEEFENVPDKKISCKCGTLAMQWR